MMPQPQSKTPWTNRRVADWCAVALFAVLLLLFYRHFLMGNCYIWDDTLEEFYPGVNYFAKSIRAGRFPLWFPGVRDGLPFYSDIQMAVFYPPQWLLALFVSKGRLPYLVYQWYIVFHYLLGGVFMYAYLRQLKLSPVGALCGAITFGFSGFMSLRIVNFVMVQVYVWLPLQLLCIDKLCSSRSRWAWSGLIGSLLLSLLAGHPQTTLYCWYLVIAYWLFRCYLTSMGRSEGGTRLARLRTRAQIARIVGTFALVLGLSAAMLLPVAENWWRTARPHQSFATLADGSLPRRELLTLFVPNFYGTSSASQKPPCPFWGYDKSSPTVVKANTPDGLRGFWQYWEFGDYAGLVFLLMFLLALFNWRQVTDKRTVGFFLVVWFGGMWFALGRFGGLFNILYHALPGVSLFRGPSKMACVAVFAAAVVTGSLTDLVWNDGRKLRLWPASLLVAAYAGLLTGLYFGGRGLLASELRQPGNMAWSRHETLWALALTALLVPSVFCLARCSGRWTRAIGLCALLAISMADFHHAYGTFHCSPTNPDDYFSQADWPVPQLRQHRKELGFFRFGQVSADGLCEELVTHRNLAYFCDLLEVPEGYTSFYLDAIARFQATTNLPARLGIQNVKLLALEERSADGRYALRFPVNTNALPRARFFTNIRQYESRDALLTALEGGELDWHKETAVWGGAAREINELVRPATMMGTDDEIRFVSKTPEAYSITYHVAQPGVVFISQAFYPGWVADGGRFKMVEVFGAFQGIVIPQPGHGEIAVRFSPPLLKVGLLVSLFSGMIAISMVVFRHV